MTTRYWSDFVPNSTFTEFWEISIEHLQRMWHADRDAYSSGHLVPSLFDLHMFYLLIPILFPNLSLFFRTMLFEYPSVLSRFCLVRVSIWRKRSLYKCGCVVNFSILMSTMRKRSFFQSLRACTPTPSFLHHRLQYVWSATSKILRPLVKSIIDGSLYIGPFF